MKKVYASAAPLGHSNHQIFRAHDYLGKHRKYSSALYPTATTDVSQALDLLDEAEERMLHLYAQRARITTDDSFRIMDLGCGWGSVTLWFAAKFPKSTFVGLSNSKTQREYILSEAAKRGLTNVDVMTGDITKYQLPDNVEQFDRVISIEMFEHMKNYEMLLNKVSKSFLKPGGLLFVHIFVAHHFPYHFVPRDDPAAWMAEHFFTHTWVSQEALPNVLRIVSGCAAGTPLADLIYSIAMSRVLKAFRDCLQNDGLLSATDHKGCRHVKQCLHVVKRPSWPDDTETLFIHIFTNTKIN